MVPTGAPPLVAARRTRRRSSPPSPTPPVRAPAIRRARWLATRGGLPHATAAAPSNALDFQDLVRLTLRLLRSETPLCRAAKRELQWRFRFVLVDEFQDTSNLQYEMLRALTRSGQRPRPPPLDAPPSAATRPGGDGNMAGAGQCQEAPWGMGVTVVGDDDQSIYSFSGANVGNFRQFAQHFRGCQEVRLQQNYRSTQTIVRVRAVLPGHACAHASACAGPAAPLATRGSRVCRNAPCSPCRRPRHRRLAPRAAIAGRQ